MAVEYWMLVALAVVAALVAGFFLGRGSAPTQQRLKALEQERDEARAEVQRVEKEVASHFEQSARMFGRLADDYRSFFEHFARTARNLGLSEGRARELLQRADPRMVAEQSTTAATGGGADGPAAAAADAGTGANGGGGDSAGEPAAAQHEVETPPPGDERQTAGTPHRDAGDDRRRN